MFETAQNTLLEGQSAALRYCIKNRDSGHVTCLHKLNGQVFIVEGQDSEVIFQHHDGSFWSSTCRGNDVTLKDYIISGLHSFEACTIPLNNSASSRSWFAIVSNMQGIIHGVASASNAQYL